MQVSSEAKYQGAREWEALSRASAKSAGKKFWDANRKEILSIALSRDPDKTRARIVSAFSANLRHKDYEYQKDAASSRAGYCYIASEAMYHLLNAKERGFMPFTARVGDKETHFWLQNRETGEKEDLTAGQYNKKTLKRLYDKGVCRGFMTTAPSQRAMEIIRRVVMMEKETWSPVEKKAVGRGRGKADKKDLSFEAMTGAEFVKNEKSVLTHDYPTDRGLVTRGKIDTKTYFTFFGPIFEEKLRNLKPDQVYLNIGSGQFVAEADYFLKIEGQAKLVAVTLGYPDTDLTAKNLTALEPFRKEGRFRLVADKSFSQFARRARTRAEVISSVYSDFSYNPDFAENLEAHHRILTPGGITGIITRGISFKSQTGKKIPVKEVLNAVEGFELLHSDSCVSLLQKTSDTCVHPEFKLLDFKARDKGKRIYFPYHLYQIN